MPHASVGGIRSFRQVVWNHYRKRGRHDLPWRNTRDPYRILVSEVMLQQTQVERVILFYAKFVKRFPTIQKLARVSLSDVLRAWQGLGYNRRAKYLHQAAKEIVARHGGRVPRDIAALEKLPGVGAYTARAVAAFAWNADEFFIETNIRTAVIHHFFMRNNSPLYGTISDAQIIKILVRALPSDRAREWYSALMDYGAHLKRSGVKLNAKSAHYAKQAGFAGSAREARGMILRTLLTKPASGATIMKKLGLSRASQMKKALAALAKEGLVMRVGKRFSLPR